MQEAGFLVLGLCFQQLIEALRWPCDETKNSKLTPASLSALGFEVSRSLLILEGVESFLHFLRG